MKINQLKAGAALSYISMVLGYLISIIYTPLMLRLLGQSEFGLYNLVASVVSYLGLLSFGFGSAYMRYYSRYKVEKDEENIAKLNGMFLVVFSIMGLISVLAGVILVFNTSLIFGDKLTISEISTAKILLGIMVFNLAISFPTTIFNSYIIANERYIFQKILQIIKVLVNPFIMLPVLLLGYKSIGMVIVTTLLTVAVEVSNVVFCFKKLHIKFSFKKFDFSLMREMTIFSSFIFINMIIDQINWNVDKFILGRFRGTIAVAVYGLAAQLNTYYLSLATIVSSVFIPRVNRMIVETDSNQKLTELFTRIGRLQSILLLLVSSGLIFFGESFISMWAGNDYKDTYPIVVILIVPGTISLIQSIGIEIQRAKNMHQFRSWVYFIISLVNIGISIPLAKVYGGIGAAIGTSMSILIGNVFIMNWYYNFKIGLDIKFFWKQIFGFVPALIVPTLSGILINRLVNLNSLLNFIIFGILYVVIYSISMWYIGMNKYEKDLLIKPIIKISKRGH